MEINCGNSTDELIGFCECEIEGNKKSINIKKKFGCKLNNFDLQNIELFELKKGNHCLREVLIKSCNKKGIYMSFWLLEL